MDKLELDARVDRLERRVSLLSALVTGLLLLIGASALFVVVARTESREAATISMPTPTPPVGATTIAAPRVPIIDHGEGSVGRLVVRLTELDELRKKSLITSLEFQDQKQALLKKPIKSRDLGPELEQIDSLRQRGALNGLEFQEIKGKLLEASK